MAPQAGMGTSVPCLVAATSSYLHAHAMAPVCPPAGLWFFSRKPVDPEATAIMEARAQGGWSRVELW